MLKFYVVESTTEIDRKGIYLIHDSWDDWFEYATSFNMWIKDDELVRIGRVKIAQKNQIVRTTILDNEFSKLEDDYFSVGFTEDYYEELKHTKYREHILTSLNDISFNLNIYEEIKHHNVTKVSLMREYSEKRLKGQVHRMALGGAKLTNYDFTYVFPAINPWTGENVRMTFEVDRENKPFSNIHVLIGKNGVGKTSVIKKMIYAFEECKDEHEVGKIERSTRNDFANIVNVSFSVFDTPILEEDFEEGFPIQYKYVGLMKPGSIKSRDSLTNEFIDCTFNFYRNTSKMRLWKDSIKILESDNTFVDLEIGEWIAEYLIKQWIGEIKEMEEHTEKLTLEERQHLLKEKHNENVSDKFSKLSSGHKIILLTIANLIDLVEEKTVVFLDEPEEHLHPPLVAAFIQALSNLLIYRNGVGIVATHSPVIVQEVPKKCVWILQRQGVYLIPRRPEIETYGENLGELTTEIFGYEVINSGFHKELKNAVEKSISYEDAKEIFDGQLGKEAKSILRAYMHDKNEDGTNE